MEIFSVKEKEKIVKNHLLKKEIAEKLEEAKNSLEKMKLKETEITAKLSILQNFQLSLELDAFAEKVTEELNINTEL